MSMGNFPFSAEMGPHKRAQVWHSLTSVRITWFLLYHAFFLDWTKFERDTEGTCILQLKVKSLDNGTLTTAKHLAYWSINRD